MVFQFSRLQCELPTFNSISMSSELRLRAYTHSQDTMEKNERVLGAGHPKEMPNASCPVSHCNSANDYGFSKSIEKGACL